MWDSSFFINALSPKFYVALTGTSSLISGLILIFEWWYFRKYGTSFIEQFSIAQLSPWFGGLPEDHNHVHMPLASAGGALNNSAGSNSTNNAANSNNRSTGGQPTHHNALDEDRDSCRVWRNPLNLYRGAEYQRFYWATNKEPLTYYDMNLSAQDHQTFFTCEADAGKPEYEIMQTAWRERNTVVRIKGARSALEKNPECAPAYILLAEEEATTIVEAEKILKQGLKVAEVQYRRSQHLLQQVSYVSGTLVEAQHRRDTNVLIYIKRRLAMCARRLGKVKEAVKIFRDLMKEVPPIMNVLNVQENLLESLLELRLYSDASVLLSRYDNHASLPPRSTALLYTAALLKARSVADKFSAETASRRGLTQNESAAIEAIHRAVEFNPHVPKYLLEQKPLILPPEHILRRGDSEAIGYAFFHLPHWKAVDGALDLLQCTWEGAFRLLPRPLEHGNAFGVYPTCTECADRELLPAFHEVSIYPKKDLPFFVLFTAGLCSFTALLTLLTHQYPEPMGHVARWLVGWLSTPFWFVYERIEGVLPSNLLQQLSRI